MISSAGGSITTRVFSTSTTYTPPSAPTAIPEASSTSSNGSTATEFIAALSTLTVLCAVVTNTSPRSLAAIAYGPNTTGHGTTVWVVQKCGNTTTRLSRTSAT